MKSLGSLYIHKDTNLVLTRRLTQWGGHRIGTFPELTEDRALVALLDRSGIRRLVLCESQPDMDRIHASAAGNGFSIYWYDVERTWVDEALETVAMLQHKKDEQHGE